MHATLTALDDAIGRRWQRTTPWIASGARVQARAIVCDTDEAVCIAAVRCDMDGLSTATLAREISALEFLAHQPAVLPLIGAGRQSGWLYAATPCTLGYSLADAIERDGPRSATEVLELLIAIADLLHFMHGAGLAHTAISAHTLFLHGERVRLGGFSSAVRLAMMPDRAECIARDVAALALTGCQLLTLHADREHLHDRAEDAPEIVHLLQRATSPHADEAFQSAIAFAQALCAVRESAVVTAREDETPDDTDGTPLSDGVERSLSVLHALLDRAEVEEQAPEPGDPLVQRCWERAVAQVAPGDARLVALRVRWRLLADRDPAGALTASHPAQESHAVWPYRARALAALGRAAEARTLAVRTWFEDVALDVPALRSLTMALVLTRAFDLATMVSATECVDGLDDPVISAAVQADRGRAMPEPTRAISAIAAAIDRRVPWTAELLVDPRWDALRGDPAFTTQVGRATAHWSS